MAESDKICHRASEVNTNHSQIIDIIISINSYLSELESLGAQTSQVSDPSLFSLSSVTVNDKITPEISGHETSSDRMTGEGKDDLFVMRI